HYGYIWPSPDNKGYKDDNALNTQPALISCSLNTKKRPLGDHDDPHPMKESKRSSLDDNDDNDDYDCSSSPTPLPPKSTTAAEPISLLFIALSPPPKEEPEEEPKCSKPKPIPQLDPKLKQEPIDEPEEDKDELEPLCSRQMRESICPPIDQA
ncbi:hypothetical protein FRC11_013618, partial [Ceratobasidium sp. 423]